MKGKRDQPVPPIVPREPPRRSARCTEPPPPDLRVGIREFNQGDFWNCHETLEAIWRVEPDPVRYLYQGILQVGVGFYHLRRGNWRGAVNKLRGGLDYLAPSAPACLGVDVNQLMLEARAILTTLEVLGPARIAEVQSRDLPRIHLLDE